MNRLSLGEADSKAGSVKVSFLWEGARDLVYFETDVSFFALHFENLKYPSCLQNWQQKGSPAGKLTERGI